MIKRLLPNEDVNHVQFDLSLALTGLLTMAGKPIRDNLVEQRAPNKTTAILSQTEEELLHLLDLTNPRASPDNLDIIRNAEAAATELQGLHSLELQEAAFGDMDFQDILVLEFILPSSVLSASDNQGCPDLDLIGGIVRYWQNLYLY